MSLAEVFGIVLAGGQSSRMRRDKATLEYRGETQLQRACALATRHTARTFVSVRATQLQDGVRNRHPIIVDSMAAEGPLTGIRSAFAAYPHAAWLVLACDLPFLSDRVLERLLRVRDPGRMATAYLSSHDGLPEPLCAIWEPAAAAALSSYAEAGARCPRKFLMAHDVHLLEPDDRRALDNVNTPEEYAAAVALLGASP